MPTSNMSSKAVSLSELEGAADDSGRYVDFRLIVRRKKTGEDILDVGGRWDRVAQDWAGDADRAHVVYIHEGQVEPARALAAWLRKRIAGESREIFHFLGPQRGGGKTHWCLIATTAISIALKGSLCWAVSPTHPRRFELEKIFRGQFPKKLGWWLWKGQPDFVLTFANGSVLRLLSGEIPNTVRQGGVEVIFLNELQDMDRKVFSLGLPAVRNIEGRPAGIMLCASNSPERARGDFVNEIADKVSSKELEGGLIFNIDPKLNTSLEHRQTDVATKWVEAIDPSIAKASFSTEWLPVGDRAFPMWRARDKFLDGAQRRGLVGELPDLGYTDVTAEMLRKVGIYHSSERREPYEHIIACDFQGRPHMAAVAGRIYRRPDGRTLYFIRHIFITKGDEVDLSDSIVDSGLYSPWNAGMIGDASGEWQSGKDRKRNLPSFDALKSQSWNIVPPREKQRAESKYASNPPIDISLGQMFAVMRDDRLLVHPDCAWLIEALEKCPLKREGAKPKIPATGGYSHITDCVRYFVYRFEEQAKAPPAAPPARGSWHSASKPRGIRIL